MARILLIDDDDDYREYLAAGLRQNGHEVTVAATGLFVLRGMRGADSWTDIDVIITDILMTDVDGLEVIRLLKASRPDCKIIAMSGGGRITSDFYLSLADAFGVETTLAKPFGIPELCKAVNNMLQAA